MVDEPQVLQIQQISTLPVTAELIAKETAKDPELITLMRKLLGDESGISNEIAMYTIELGCIMRGIRVYIPSNLRKLILEELHFGHLGIVKMKGLARSYVYWPGIDKDIEETAKCCVKCLRRSKEQHRAAIHPWEFPGGPWQRLHLDFAGPFAGQYFFIIVDAYSKWLEVYPMRTITAAATIEKLCDCFARFGLPVTCVSDNGAQFSSFEFEQFLKNNGIKHVFSAPYYPASNGQAERYMQTVKEALRTTVGDKGSIYTKLNDFLLRYRIAHHSTTGESPAMLMKRNLRSRLDLLIPNVGAKVKRNQEKMVEQGGNQAFKGKFEMGDKVIFRMYNNSDKWYAGTVVDSIGSVMYKIFSDNYYFVRHENQMRSSSTECLGPKPNSEFFQNIKQPTPRIPEPEVKEKPEIKEESPVDGCFLKSTPVSLRRSSRVRRPPGCFSPD